MPDAKINLLIVDDEASIRTSMSLIFSTLGYKVRSAEDGIAALGEIRNEVPEILLSDLNMPRMSGFELLSVVRRRFPAIRVIAMSGVFSGNEVPLGVAAEVFFEKGSSPGDLVRMVKTMAHATRPSILDPSTSVPAWIAMNGHDPSGEEYVLVTCPECLRAFPQVLGKDVRLIRETHCVHCSGLIQYAIVQPAGGVVPQAPPGEPGEKVICEAEPMLMARVAPAVRKAIFCRSRHSL